MPAKPALHARAADEVIDINEAGDRVGYSPNTLRTMMFRDADPPPLFKRRHRWVGRPAELDAWIARRDGLDL